MNLLDRAPVLCVDEKSQTQALDRTRPGLPLKKGRAATLTHDYKRLASPKFAPEQGLADDVFSWMALSSSYRSKQSSAVERAGQMLREFYAGRVCPD